MSDSGQGRPLTAEDWAARYIDELGNLRPVPANGGVPDKRVRYSDARSFAADFSDIVDQVGPPDGEVFTVLGGDFDQRALLPEAVNHRIHTYRLTGSLPAGWQIEVGRTAPAFGRSGGAMYVVVLGVNGQKMNAFELLDTGVLDVVAD